MSGKKPTYEQIKENDWLIEQVLKQFQNIKDGSGHGEIRIVIQGGEVFEIRPGSIIRNPKFMKKNDK